MTGAGVGVAVGGTGVEVDVGVAVAVAGMGVEVGAGVFVFVAVGSAVGNEVGVFVADGGEADRLHIEKSFAMQPRLVVYQPSSANEMFTLCVPSATGTK